MEKKKQRRRSRAGFTLIEILLVVTIISLLAGIVAVSIPKYNMKARIAKAKADIDSIGVGIQSYLLDTGKYPASLDALTQGDDPVIASIPLDPWQNPYKYVYPGTHKPYKYDLWSAGPDGVDNTDDDIANWKTDNAPGGGVSR
jgi:general secretion pathway protein G